jgi:DNA-binding SARP family transcriptional activator
MSMERPWRIELLGGLRAAREDRSVSHFPTRKTALLLARLAYFPARPHPREELIELLWPEADPHAARQRLSQALSSLRRILEPRSVEKPPQIGPVGRSTLNPLASRVLEPSTLLLADRTSVWLNRAAVTTDVAEFQAAFRSTRNSDSRAEQARWLARTVELYAGPLLPGFFDNWVLQEREWLAEQYLRTLGQLLAHLEDEGDQQRALQFAQQAVAADPLREEAHRDLIRLLAAVGQPAAATRQFRELERLLKEHLGAAPELATRALIREIERRSLLPRAVPSLSSPANDQPDPIPASSENRIVTVVVAGLSRTPRICEGGSDTAAELLHRLLPAAADLVLAYEGEMIHSEDGRLLAVFGSAQAHEDDPERAIRAALGIRQQARHLGLKLAVGINTGEATVDFRAGIAALGLRADPVSDPASHLQERAQPDQILAAAATRYLTRRAFQFTSVSLPNPLNAARAAAYMVERALLRPEKARGLEGRRTELVGRDDELARLQAALAAVLQGRGQMVSLIGEAGIGKSRLVAELKRGAGRWVLGAGEDRSSAPSTQYPAPLWLEGRCLELSMGASYSAFVDLFRDYFARSCGGERSQDGSREWGGPLAATLRQFVTQQALSAERVAEMGPLLGRLLSLRLSRGGAKRLKNASPEQIRHQTLVALRDFFVALARSQPVVLVLEDLHWADSLSLDVLSLLMEALPPLAPPLALVPRCPRREGACPLLLLCVYRPEPESTHSSGGGTTAWSGAGPRGCRHLAAIASRKCAECYTEIQLRELTPTQGRRLVEALLNTGGLPVPLVERILSRAHGNPFFVEELVRSLTEAGVLHHHEGTWQIRPEGGSAAVPEGVQSIIRCRLDHLDPRVKPVLEVASVIGRLFRPRLLGKVLSTGQASGRSEETPEHLNACLTELEDRGLIYQERAVPEVEYSFKHVLTQETIYGGISQRRRTQFHQWVGEALEALYPRELDSYCEQLAYHYERSDADEKAIDYLLKAGEKSRRSYLNEEAMGYFQRALARLERAGLVELRPEWRLPAHHGLGLVCFHGMGSIADAETHFRQAIHLAQKIDWLPGELVRLYYRLGGVLWQTGQWDEMIRAAKAGLSLVRETPESAEAALMNGLLAVAYGGKGDRERVREYQSRNAQFLKELPYVEELGGSYTYAARYCVSVEQNLDQALEWLQTLDRSARLHHDLMGVALAHSSQAELLLAAGDLLGAHSGFQRSLELFVRMGKAWVAALECGNLGEILLTLGDLPAAAEYFRSAHENAETMQNQRWMNPVPIRTGLVLLCQGQRERASDTFRSAIQHARERGQSDQVASASYCLGRTALLQGDRQGALLWFQDALALYRRHTAFDLGSLAAAWKALPLPGSPGELVSNLGGLEEAFDSAEAFRAFCRRFRAKHPKAADLPLLQWFLEPAEPTSFPDEVVHELFTASLSPDWSWHDPYDDCAYRVQDGIRISAANGRELKDLNLSAPRILRPGPPLRRVPAQRVDAPGDFAIQTIVGPVSPERPAIGGLLLWKDRQNFLRLDIGTCGRHEIRFQGCVRNNDVIIGRGRLLSERIFLRLERLGRRVNALCSADGEKWFTVGQVEFPVADPLEVGLHAIGMIDRLVYPGAWPEGTAIRFETFQMFGRTP